MFTGIIQTKGIVESVAKGSGGYKLTVMPSTPFAGLERGESIAVNGVCLTVETFTSSGRITFHTLAETLRRTNLGKMAGGGTVNMERALEAGGRLGGHIVSGHIDTVIKLLRKRKPARQGEDWEFELELPQEYAPLVVEKGSVALDGITLTVAAVAADRFKVCLIPVTLADTALAERAEGEGINFEADVVGKYVQRILECRTAGCGKNGTSGNITMDTLAGAGFL